MRKSMGLLVLILVVGLMCGAKQAASPKPSNADENCRKAGERMVKTVDGVEYAFRWCPPGTFTMGVTNGYTEPSGLKWWISKTFFCAESVPWGIQHQVTLTQGFWMLETEVTQTMWKSVMDSSPSKFKGANLPVEQVSWDDCQEFCRRLSAKIGMNLSLPTEAQWEYACRAGTTSYYYWGDDESPFYQYGNYCDRSNTDGFSWQDKNHSDGYDKTAPVRSYKPNAWGLYDMSGNVWEWCQDRCQAMSGNWSKRDVTDPAGPDSGSFRIKRGGGWDSEARVNCWSANSSADAPDNRLSCLGFRPVASGQ